MEKDTVILNLQDYNELRDIKKAVDNKKKIFGWLGGMADYVFVDEEDFEKAFVKENEHLNEEIKRLRGKIYNLQHPKKSELSLDEIKKMSLWQFLKWKRR